MPANPYNLPPSPRVYDVRPVSRDITPSLDVYKPGTFEEAVDYLLGQGLDEVNAYAGQGYERFRRYAAEELVVAYFPQFALESSVSAPADEAAGSMPSAVSTFFERHKRSDGSIDWQSVARDPHNHYIVSSTSLENSAPNNVMELPKQLGSLSMVDPPLKVG